MNGVLTVREKDAMGKPKFEWGKLAKCYDAWDANTSATSQEPLADFDLSPRPAGARQAAPGVPDLQLMMYQMQETMQQVQQLLIGCLHKLLE